MSKIISGILGDTFEIEGRGVVIIIKAISGDFHVGDILKVGKLSTPIKGIEMINYGRILPPEEIGFGVIVRGEKLDYVDLRGAAVQIETRDKND